MEPSFPGETRSENRSSETFARKSSSQTCSGSRSRQPRRRARCLHPHGAVSRPSGSSLGCMRRREVGVYLAQQTFFRGIK